MGFKSTTSSGTGGFAGFIFNTVLRFLQLVLALTVIGLYGGYVNDARLAHKYADGNYVYAVVVSSLAAVTALVYMVPFVKTHLVFGWDVVLFILWTALFGIFGKMFIHEDPEGNAGIQRMKNAVWVDLVNMILWLLSSLYGAGMFFKNRSSRSLHTGRAAV